MSKINFAEALATILQADSRYEREAYFFVREGLDFTLKMVRRGEQGPTRHVSGQELLEGLRRYSLQQFGPMTKTVLNYWGITRCEDFAEIVFNMVDRGILGKTEQDSRDDFKGGYDFDEAFVKPYRPTPRPAACRAGGDEPTESRVLRPTGRNPDKEKLSSGPN